MYRTLIFDDMRKQFFLIALILTGFVGFSQDILIDPLFIKYEETFKTAYNNNVIDLYNAKSEEYNEKINKNKKFNDTPDNLERILKADLKETKFKTVEEGVNLKKEIFSLLDEVREVTKENNTLFIELQKKYTAKEIFEAYELRNDPFKI